jgi:hypothetical protein
MTLAGMLRVIWPSYLVAGIRLPTKHRIFRRTPEGQSLANTLAAKVLGADPHEAGGRRVIFLSGEDAPAKAAVAGLFDAAGFFTIDLGGLVTGGRLQQVGGPLPSHNLVRLPPVR